MEDIKTLLLRTIAVDANQRQIPLTGTLKKIFDDSTPDEIANTEIALLNAEYDLKSEAKDETL